MTDQTVPTSEVTDAHVRAYRHAFDIAASGPWVGSDECIRAGLAAVFTMAAPLSSPPSAGEAREVPGELPAHKHRKLIADSLYRRLDVIGLQVRILTEAVSRAEMSREPEVRDEDQEVPAGSVLDHAIGFTILRTEMQYVPPGAREVYVQVPENDLNSQDPWGVFEEVAERNAKHAKDRAETESWMDLDDGHPWTVAALVPVTEAELEAYGKPRPVSPPLPTEPGAVIRCIIEPLGGGGKVHVAECVRDGLHWAVAGVAGYWERNDVTLVEELYRPPAPAGVAAPDPAKEK